MTKEAVEASHVHIFTVADFHLRRSDRAGDCESIDAPANTLGRAGETAGRRGSAALKPEP
jgi:hypothetical protein